MYSCGYMYPRFGAPGITEVSSSSDHYKKCNFKNFWGELKNVMLILLHLQKYYITSSQVSTKLNFIWAFSIFSQQTLLYTLLHSFHALTKPSFFHSLICFVHSFTLAFDLWVTWQQQQRFNWLLLHYAEAAFL